MKITEQELIDGLATLDPKTDAHWTADGEPALEAVRDALLDDTISREDVNAHANGFNREVAADAIANLGKSKDAEVAKLRAAPDLAGVAPLAQEGPLDGGDPEGGVAQKEALDEAVLTARQALEDHDAAVAKAKLRRDELVAAVDRATRDRDSLFPPLRPAEAIQEWIASEHQKRLARAEQVMQVAVPKSAIDASMARRTGYGGGRKSVPLLAG